jgi:muramidase (phage lysozyme)
MSRNGALWLLAGVAAYVLWSTTKSSAPATDGSTQDFGVIGDNAGPNSWDDNSAPPTEVTEAPLGLWNSFTSGAASLLPNYFSKVMDQSTLQNPNMQAFLALIRTGEGTTGPNGYNTLYGGRLFSGYADHPPGAVTAGRYTSTAAGAYQILQKTWDEIKAQYNLPDFSPQSQDIAAIALISRRGALDDVLSGNFTSAINKCNKEWASLPGSPYGQPTLTFADAADILAKAGGTQTA